MSEQYATTRQPERDRWNRVKEILASALEVPAAERQALLAVACGDDSELRQEVETLLEFSDAAGVGERIDELSRHYADTVGAGTSAILDELWRQLQQYFARERRDFTLPLAYPGTKFQQQVWTALQEICCGDTWPSSAWNRSGRAPMRS